MSKSRKQKVSKVKSNSSNKKKRLKVIQSNMMILKEMQIK